MADPQPSRTPSSERGETDPQPRVFIPQEVLRAIYDADANFNEDEIFIIRWQYRLLGDFQTALMKAIAVADENNFALLALAFPMQTFAFSEWSHGDMGERLRSRGIPV